MLHAKCSNAYGGMSGLTIRIVAHIKRETEKGKIQNIHLNTERM